MPLLLIAYILREFGRALIPALLIYTFVILPFWMAGIVREGVGIVTVAAVLPLIFPFISGYVMPPALLTASILCWGRMGSTNEYAASQAGGIWPGYVLLPGMLVGILTTFGTLYLNDDVLTYSTNAITRILAQGKVDMIEQMLNQRGVVRIGNFHLYRFPVDDAGRQALDMSIYEERPSGPGGESQSVLVMRAVAQDHAIRVTPEQDEMGNIRNVVLFDLKNCRVERFQGDHSDFVVLERYEKPLYLDQNARFSITNKRVACWGISQLVRAIRKRNEEIVRDRGAIAESRNTVTALRTSLEQSLTPEQQGLKLRIDQKTAAQAAFKPTDSAVRNDRLQSELRDDITTLNRQFSESLTAQQMQWADKLRTTMRQATEAEENIGSADNSLRKYYRELNSRIALSTCCLFFGVIGPLLGLLARQQDRAVLFASGFGVTAVYLVLFILCRNLADFGGFVLWVPNILLGVTTLALWRKLY